MSKIVSSKIWMPFYIKDHRATASTMSHIEHSGYCYLMMLFWERDGVIQDDDKFIAKSLRMNFNQWKKIRRTLISECVISDGLITHPKTVLEVAKANGNIEQKRRAGIASAEARKGNGCSTAVPTESQRNGNGWATAGQPRAGGGGGDVVLSQPKPRKEVSSKLTEVESARLRIVE